MKPFLTALFFALAVLEGTGASLSIPADRLPGGVLWTNWSPGVIGGIPNVTTVYTNLFPTANEGFNFTNILFALFSCPSNEVVFLNAGDYPLTNSLQFGSRDNFWFGGALGNNGVVLRGAGMGKSNLKFGDNCSLQISGHGYDSSVFITNNARLWTGGYAQGSTNITLVSAFSGLTNGDYICLTEEMDPSLVQNAGTEATNTGIYTNYLDLHTNLCYQFQWVQVTNIVNGTNLSIWPGIYTTNYQALLLPQVLWAGTHDPAMKCGVESLTIDTSNQGVGNGLAALIFYGAFNCWVTNVEFLKPNFAAVNFSASAHNTVQECYMHDSLSGGTSTSYGVYWAITADNLAQDNIIYKITSPLLIQHGAQGCVFAYNYCTNMIYTLSPGTVPSSLNFHGAHPMMNLCEGNVGTSFSCDIIHGSASHDMVFRNWFYGYQANINNYNPFILNNMVCISIASSNRFMSVIGNVLGTVGIHTNYEDSVNNYPTNFMGEIKYDVYYLGYWGNEAILSPPTSNGDLLTANTLLRTGNYDTATLTTVWDTNGVKTLPSSLYLASKPGWWGSGVWPSIGSDLTPMVSVIPAQTRFDAQVQSGGQSPGPVGYFGGGTFGSWRTQ